jgi:hypothetical protein
MPTPLIACGVIALIGIVFVVLSRENWKWQNITLVTLLLLLSTLFYFLAAKNLRLQQGWRNAIKDFESAVSKAEKQVKDLRDGKYDEAENKWIEPSVAELQRRVQTIMQGRGRIWFQAVSGRAGNDGSLPVKVEPAAHGIAEKTILFVFDGVPSNPNGQFVGEFEVSKVAGQELTLSPVLPLRPTEVPRIAQRSGKPLFLYEIMPADSHDIYAALTPAERVALFSGAVPPDVKQQFAKDGNPPEANETDAANIWRRVKALKSFDISVGVGNNAEKMTVPEGAELILDPKSADERIASGDVAAVEGNDKVYRRTLRDYLRLYRELNLSIDAQLRSIEETKRQLAIVQEAQKKVTADLDFRKKEQKLLTSDKNRFDAENARVKAHVTALEEELKKVNADLREVYEKNVQLEEELVKVSYELANKLRNSTVAGSP